jgi:pyruvate formate lyase activating enzyme
MASVDYKAKGIVFDIQRFSIHDGPGIRTIVFLKGCPMSCLWCSNPESQKLEPEIMRQQEQCIYCGRCAGVCPAEAISPKAPGVIDREKCIGCGECASICPTGALVLKGETKTVEQVVREVAKDAITYRKSGGGVTLSGGEPLVQWQFAVELLKAFKSQGWHTAMETNGIGSDEAIEAVFPHVDLVLLDIKAMDALKHKDFTGVLPDRVHRNAQRISQIAKVTVRVPTIPGFNANDQEFNKIAEFAKTLNNVDAIHILPYHTYGSNKYEMLDVEYPLGFDVKPLEPHDVEGLRKIVESHGLRCQIGG